MWLWTGCVSVWHRHPSNYVGGRLVSVRYIMWPAAWPGPLDKVARLPLLFFCGSFRSGEVVNMFVCERPLCSLPDLKTICLTITCQDLSMTGKKKSEHEEKDEPLHCSYIDIYTSIIELNSLLQLVAKETCHFAKKPFTWSSYNFFDNRPDKGITQPVNS